MTAARGDRAAELPCLRAWLDAELLGEPGLEPPVPSERQVALPGLA